jgi:hypothetical protein
VKDSCVSLGGEEGQFKDKRSAFAGPFALADQGAAQFFGGEGAAMESEAMTAGAGGESVVEDAGEVFQRDTNAIINDGDPNPFSGFGQLNFQLFVFVAGIVTGIFGIANQIHEDLQDLVFFQNNGRELAKVTNDFDLVPDEGAGIHAQGIFH